MYAEAVATIGLAAEVATSVYPQHFLLLACSGTFAKAVGKGMGKPAFRCELQRQSNRMAAGHGCCFDCMDMQWCIQLAYTRSGECTVRASSMAAAADLPCT